MTRKEGDARVSVCCLLKTSLCRVCAADVLVQHKTFSQLDSLAHSTGISETQHMRRITLVLWVSPAAGSGGGQHHALPHLVDSIFYKVEVPVLNFYSINLHAVHSGVTGASVCQCWVLQVVGRRRQLGRHRRRGLTPGRRRGVDIGCAVK